MNKKERAYITISGFPKATVQVRKKNDNKKNVIYIFLSFISFPVFPAVDDDDSMNPHCFFLFVFCAIIMI